MPCSPFYYFQNINMIILYIPNIYVINHSLSTEVLMYEQCIFINFTKKYQAFNLSVSNCTAFIVYNIPNRKISSNQPCFFV
ncbi:hypothetical protein UYO_1141 [Lachnospiraceae bacterium JC7]|nr:hypothetical protein UYO_1141 [Lachnospiraceae bacterium JC7]